MHNIICNEYEGNQTFDRFSHPLGTIGYSCVVHDVDERAYLEGRLKMSVNSGLPERDIELHGNAAIKFMEDMQVQTPREINGRRVSVFLGPGFERISRR